MAIYNEILAPRYARMLQKLFGMKGSVPTKQLAGEITTTINLFSGVENRNLETWDRFAFSNLFLAAAGNGGGWRFRNPSSSNVIAIFEKLRIDNENAGNAVYASSLGPMTLDLATNASTAQSRMDARGRQSSTVIPSGQNSVAGVILGLSAPFARTIVAAGTGVDLILDGDHQLTVLPGDSLQVVTVVVNSEIGISALWRERFLEESERT